MSSTLFLPGENLPLTDAADIQETIGDRIDLIVDAGTVGIEPTTVIDLSKGDIEIIRDGLGDTSALVS